MAELKPLKSLLWECPTCELRNEPTEFKCIACFRPCKLEYIQPALTSICQLFGRNEWKCLPNSCFETNDLTGGFTNRLYTVTVYNDNNKNQDRKEIDKAVIRIFNIRKALSMAESTEIYELFAALNIGTQLYGTFKIGQIEKFVETRQLITSKYLKENENLLFMGIYRIAEIHLMKPKMIYDRFIKEDEKQSQIVSNVKQCIVKACKLFDKQIKLQSDIKKWQFMLDFECNKNEFKFNKLTNENVSKIFFWELNWLVNKLDSLNDISTDLVFCHNDFYAANMLYHCNDDTPKESNEIGNIDFRKFDKIENIVKHESYQRLKIIDYDYCCFNYRCYDISNFISELCIDNFHSQPPYFVLDRTLGPSKEQQKELVKHYLRMYHDLDDINSVDSKEVEMMMNGIEYGCMLSSFWWTMWGIIESTRTKPNGWDHCEYARQRLMDYYQLKQKSQQ